MVDAVGSNVHDGVELSPSERVFHASELTVDLVLRAERRKSVRQNIDAFHQFDPVDCRKIRGVRIGHAACAENGGRVDLISFVFLTLSLGGDGSANSTALYRS